MGLGDKLAVAYPASSLLRDYDYDYGGTLVSSYVTQTNPLTRRTVDLHLTRFAVRNRMLRLRLDKFNIWTAATGASAPYTPTAGSEFQLYWLPHRTNNPPADADFLTYGLRVPTTRPYVLEVSPLTVPPALLAPLNPADPSYDATLSISFYWGNVNYYHDIDVSKVTNYFEIVKLDQDIAI